MSKDEEIDARRLAAGRIFTGSTAPERAWIGGLPQPTSSSLVDSSRSSVEQPPREIKASEEDGDGGVPGAASLLLPKKE